MITFTVSTQDSKHIERVEALDGDEARLKAAQKIIKKIGLKTISYNEKCALLDSLNVFENEEN